jgi:hypothetical protein
MHARNFFVLPKLKYQLLAEKSQLNFLFQNVTMSFSLNSPRNLVPVWQLFLIKLV